MSFIGCHPTCWKHQTSEQYVGPGKTEVGVDLFDDEFPDQTSVYVRLEDGTRFPARSVDMLDTGSPGHSASVLAAWARKGPVNDYRTTFKGVGLPAGSPSP